VTLDAHRRDQVTRLVRPIGAGLARMGLTADALTAIGLLFVVSAAVALLLGRPVTAGVLLALGGIADLLDGSVARARGGTTVRGGFYDSVADRVADGVILAAVAWVVRADPVLFGLAVAALLSAEVTSYIRAKAESLGYDCSVGLFERAERTIILVAGLVFHAVLLAIAIGVLALGGVFTVVQRLVHVARAIRAVEGRPGARGR
jgi:phosphatidylglycerophosphate synthase